MSKPREIIWTQPVPGSLAGVRPYLTSAGEIFFGSGSAEFTVPLTDR